MPENAGARPRERDVSKTTDIVTAAIRGLGSYPPAIGGAMAIDAPTAIPSRGSEQAVLYRTILPAVAKPFDPRVISGARPRRESETNRRGAAYIASHYYPGVAQERS
jgi:hypothetical protein